jgi:beta-1,4-N-acetylglucosaminyltransferase
MKLCLVTSAGGHFFQLFQLKELWQDYDRFWITFDKSDVTSMIPNEKKYYAHYPESRNAINAIKNLFMAISILRKERPTALISIGAGVAVPFFTVAKLFRLRTIYIEPIDFIRFPSLTGKLISMLHLSDLFLVQSKLQIKFFPTAKYWGSTL